MTIVKKMSPTQSRTALKNPRTEIYFDVPPVEWIKQHFMSKKQSSIMFLGYFKENYT